MDSTLLLAITWTISVMAFVMLYNRLDARGQDERDKMYMERAEWKMERQMLLDRIQAPTFAEYTNKVVREKKMEKKEEEERPIEFIS